MTKTILVIIASLLFLNKSFSQQQLPEETRQHLIPLNIDFMLRGSFYVYSTPIASEFSGGWATSSNIPIDIPRQLLNKNGNISILIDSKISDTINKKYQRYPVWIINQSKDTSWFNAQDSRLDMTIEAMDQKGIWKNIVYLPNSWCGNSYHTVVLEPGKCWKLKMPVFNGEIKTKLRIKLLIANKNNLELNSPIYSNIIEGSINLTQFLNKVPYQPNGIMDPYWD